MLKVTRRGKVEGLRDLSAHEDRALRDAFGRWPEPRARPASAAVVQAHQRFGAVIGFRATAYPLHSPVPSSPYQNRIPGIITSRPGWSTIRSATSFGTTSSSEQSLGPSSGGSVIGRVPFWPG
jgi:hypothetical protein